MLHRQNLLHLQYNDFLGLFPSHIRSHILNNSETRTCKAGTTIFRRGEEGPWMGGILTGRVRIILRSSDNKEMFLSMFERGEIFGERALLDELPRGADAVAEEETTYIVMKRAEILPLLFQYPEAMFCIVKILCNRLLRYTETIQLNSQASLPTRLATYLLFLARSYGSEVDGQKVIRAGLNQSDMGQKLAASRESINRQLKVFVEQGLVSIRGDEIVLLDSAALEKICEATPNA